jgi:hypothetical protein
MDCAQDGSFCSHSIPHLPSGAAAQPPLGLGTDQMEHVALKDLMSSPSPSSRVFRGNVVHRTDTVSSYPSSLRPREVFLWMFNFKLLTGILQSGGHTTPPPSSDESHFQSHHFFYRQSHLQFHTFLPLRGTVYTKTSRINLGFRLYPLVNCPEW